VTIMLVAGYILESLMIVITLLVEGSKGSDSGLCEWTRLFWVESVIF